MSITSDQVQAAVERFLPRELSVARDGDSGSLDQDQVMDRALLIARTSLMLDIESPFYPLSMAITAWGESLESILESLSSLASDDLLLALRDEAPHYIDDVGQLVSARSSLLKLQGSIGVNDTFSSSSMDDFASSIDGFVSDHVIGNVVNRNRVVIREETKALFLEMEKAWADVLDKKTELLAQIDSFFEVDLKSTVSSEIITAIRYRIGELQDDLTSANGSEQAALAEQILVDLAAARAVMMIIQNAPTYESDEVDSIPAIGEDGFSPKDYLQRQGKAYLEPLSVVLLPTSGDRYGTAGRIHIDPISKGLNGEGIDDADGDIITPDFRDDTTPATFVSDGVLEGHSLFLVQTGTSHRILGSVNSFPPRTDPTETDLVVTPEIPFDLGGDSRYIVTESILGTYFKDLNESFWTEYADGESGSNVVMSGTNGEFSEDVRLSGDEGTNAKDYDSDGSPGEAGETGPARSSGSDGNAHGAILMHSDDEGNGILRIEIASGSDGSGSFGSDGWSSSSAAFDTDHVHDGDYLWVETGPNAGVYEIARITSPTLLEIVGTFPATAGGAHYHIRTDSILYHASGLFTSDLDGSYCTVLVYDGSSHVLYGPLEVTYLSSTRVRLSVAQGTFINDPSTQDFDNTGRSFGIYNVSTFQAFRFHSETMGNLASLAAIGDQLIITGAGDLDFNQSWEILSVVDDNTVLLDGTAGGYFNFDNPAFPIEKDITWKLVRGDIDYLTAFYDSTGEFLTRGVAVGDVLYLDDGAGPDVGQDYEVVSVDSQTSLTVDLAFTDSRDDYEWHISPPTTDFFQDLTVMMYSGIFDPSVEYALEIVNSLPVDHIGTYDLDEDGRSIHTLSIDDTLSNSVFHEYATWKVVPADGLTWLFTQSDLDFSDWDGGGSSLGATISFEDKFDATYLVVDGYDPVQVLFTIREDLYDLESAAYTLRFGDRYAVDAGPLDWAIWRGLTTDVFKDTVNSPFGSSAVGDVIRLDPNGPDQTDHFIIEVVSSSEVRVAPDLDAGETGLTYAVFGSVKPGMELITAGRRTVISDIVDEHILKLSKPLPSSSGKGLTWYVVLPGTDINTSRITDRDAGFVTDDGFGTVDVITGEVTAHDWALGSTVHLMGNRQLQATVVGVADPDGDLVCETLILDVGMPIWENRISYKVLDFEEFKTKTFNVGSMVDINDVVVGDYLTVWGINDLFTVDAIDVAANTLEVTPRITAGAFEKTFAICRNGAKAYGRYILLEYLLNKLSMSEDLTPLELHLAEVIADFGGTLQETVVPVGLTEPIVFSASKQTDAAFLDDGDDDDTTAIMVLTTNQPTIRAGDYIVMDLDSDDVAEAYSYVKSVDHSDPTQTTLVLWHEFTSSDPVTYLIYRNSVSFVLDEVYNTDTGLYSQVQAIKDVADAFIVAPNPGTDSTIEMFRSLSMDSAIDTLQSGDLVALSEMDATGASYSAIASGAVNTLGQTTESLEDSSGVNGENPDGETGSSGSSGSRYSSPLAGEVEVRLSLAELAEHLAGRRRTEESATNTMEDMISRSVYELIGENDTGFLTDDDKILPWITITGSKKDRCEMTKEEAIAALDYMIAHPDEFKTVGDE
jgi:hypothetical protein